MENTKAAASAVDMSKAKAGDVAVFRCGGKWEIEKIEPSIHQPDRLWIKFSGSRADGVLYLTNGGLQSAFETHYGTTPFAIVAIEHKEFDWKDARPGMAFIVSGFKSHSGRVVVFEAWSTRDVDPEGRLCLITSALDDTNAVDSYTRSFLKRAPEHDVVPEKVGA